MCLPTSMTRRIFYIGMAGRLLPRGTLTHWRRELVQKSSAQLDDGEAEKAAKGYRIGRTSPQIPNAALAVHGRLAILRQLRSLRVNTAAMAIAGSPGRSTTPANVET